MRWFSLALVLLAGCARHSPARDDRMPPSASAVVPRSTLSSAAPFAVVELFTSEGCSSCPPADRHLADLEADARTRGRNVLPLAFHVDYWNYIGWRDPFSDARHSERQKLYARALSGGQLYTPQMVVNGREEFTGTARAKVLAAIERDLEQPASLAIAIAPQLAGDELEVGYRLEGDTRSAVLHVAVTQPAPAVHVSSGENAGRTLAHRAVVRAFESRALNGEPTGSVRLDLPAGVDAAQANVVAYAADAQTLAILGATASPLAAR
jgi:hypothetical protein